MKCSNAARGCDWEGTLGTIEEHVAKCEFALVPCPKECEDNNEVQHFMRKDLPTHLESECPNREYECELCGEKDTYTSITVTHDKTCGKKLVPCQNIDCTVSIQRQCVQKHLDKCKFTEVACKYQRLGCDVKMKRKDMPAHEDEDKLHLRMALGTIVTMGEEMDSMKKDIKTLQEKQPFTFTLRSFTEYKDRNKMFKSPSFYTSFNGYHVDIKVYPNGIKTGKGTYVSIFARFLDSENNAYLSWPFVGEVTFILLNQLADEKHFQKTVEITSDMNIRANSQSYNRGYCTFTPHSDLSHNGSTQYLKNDTLFFRVSFEMPNARPWLHGE